MIHYRCLTSYTPKTTSEQVSGTTELFPTKKKYPRLSPEYAVTNTESNLTEALQNPAPSSLIPKLGEKQTETKSN